MQCSTARCSRCLKRASLGDAPSWARIDAGEQARLRDTFKALEVFVDGEVNLRGDILTVVIVAMRAMLTRRSSVPDGTSPEADPGATKSSTKRGPFQG